MNLSPIVLGAALALPTPATAAALFDDLLSYHSARVNTRYRHESEEGRAERLRWIAEGVVAACGLEPLEPKLGWKFDDCVALGATAAKWESGLLREIHSGERLGQAGERCLFQLHRFVADVPNVRYRVTQDELASTTGLSAEATARCALAGVRVLRWHVHRCGLRRDDAWSVARLFAEYHQPSTLCNAAVSSMSRQRSASFRHLVSKLHASVRVKSASQSLPERVD